MEGRPEEPLVFEGTCETVGFNTRLKTRLATLKKHRESQAHAALNEIMNAYQ
jgi:hypothetical protein